MAAEDPMDRLEVISYYNAELVEYDPVQDIIDRLDRLVDFLNLHPENPINALGNAGIQDAIHDVANDINDLPQVYNINQVEEFLSLLETQVRGNSTEVDIRAIQNAINDLWQAATVEQGVIVNFVVGVVNYNGVEPYSYKDQFVKVDDIVLPIPFNFSDIHQPLIDFNLVQFLGVMDVIKSYTILSEW